jgi:hypothetical protein
MGDIISKNTTQSSIMLEKVTVTYDGSAFYPETHLNLEPNTRYTIQIISQEKQTETPQKLSLVARRL